ncbi:PLDc N-terminal domain-containing protein [Oleiharenicola lentus]|uniref:PLDc N-terminal domain-containing protein n=1 Tax=Oleiharenicola lentus TaxID=2508720 RepID=UPI003F66596B
MEIAKIGRMNINYLISVLCLVFWLVALIDCIKSNNPNKVVWIIVIILLPFLGSILYFLIGRGGR